MALTEEEKRNYLNVLGLSPDATYDEVKSAYSSLMKMYNAEKSVLTPLISEFPKRKKESIVKELKVAYDSIIAQIEPKKSPKIKKKMKTLKSSKSEQQHKDELDSSLPIMADIHEKLDMEEKKLWKKFIFDFGLLMRDETTLISSMADLSKKLQNLEERMKSEKWENQDIQNKLLSLISKVEEIQKIYSYSLEGVIGFRKTLKVTSKGNTLPEQISDLRKSISCYQGVPTQIQFDKYRKIKARIDSLLNKVSEIKDKDIPDLNDLLRNANYPLIKNLK
ncbi:hypothetical protein ACFLRX_02020 [Acidobacteriota bacterium]